ncbi:MAG: sigma-54 dependent transcriptional regulator [Firmicutes bacterium]|nr:sigma-54 dependent transcriptional regulator [Bacillota bacterium]
MSVKGMLDELRAPWLGSWAAPWGLGRGRRWGDAAWGLAAISQAWLLGGAEGRWPELSWSWGKEGPKVEACLGAGSARPDPRWVALLRHGSRDVPATQRGRKEDERTAWCWEALLEGDGLPWMSQGTVLFSKAERFRWIPVLGAVDAQGTLRLPPFLEPLVPAWLRRLPEGWWPFLLRALDTEGRLLPEGVPPKELPWAEWLAQGPDTFMPLVLDPLPEALQSLRGTAWLQELEGGWMASPWLRAWGRGFGPVEASLKPWAGTGLAFGDEPTPFQRSLLDGEMPAELSDSWKRPLELVLASMPVYEPPPLSGDPTLDRIFMRWRPTRVEQAPGYPAWGESAHPCADPFHWMAEGYRAYGAGEAEQALRAFSWAYGHFMRLDSPWWADRAAANAGSSALHWGSLPAMANWRALQAPPPPPFDELEAASLLAMRDEWEEALPRLRRLCETHPENEVPWTLLAFRGLDLENAAWVAECLPHIRSDKPRTLFQGFLEGMWDEPPANLGLEEQVCWRLYQAKRDPAFLDVFWQAWDGCHSQLLRLDAGLMMLERRPEERTAQRLLTLQVLADRTDSPRHQARLAALWPELALEPQEEPSVWLRTILARRSLPAWLVWGSQEHPLTLGPEGHAAPEGALSRLHQHGALAPFEHEGHLWRGFPLTWEGAVVGHALTAISPDAIVDKVADVHLLAPWVAKLAPAAGLEAPPDPGALLMDGSEPMATLMRELARIAPSELTVLVLGPSGSGKELMAREIHRRSGRTGPLVAVNCSAFAESLMESELFGHVKGAFTGADRDRRGAIEVANQGTLFLDEVADLSPRIQSLFLRVLQEREVRRVGSDRAIHVDVRFVAATHRSLDNLVEAGGFRRDLLFRLQGSVLNLPSLRERRHEFPYLVPRLLLQLAKDMKRSAPELSPGLSQALSRLPWPGNFRELRHALERALLRCGSGPLKPEHFPELQVPEAKERTWEEATRAFQKRLLLDTLRRHAFQVTEAAQALGIARPALYLAAKRIGLDLIAARKAWEAERQNMC